MLRGYYPVFGSNHINGPIFSLVKMIADILIHALSKSGTVYNFDNFFYRVFSFQVNV